MALIKSNGKGSGNKERWITGLIGGAFTAYGLTRRSWPGKLLALGGAALIYDGVSGKRFISRSIGIPSIDKNRSPLATVGHGEGIKIERSVVIQRAPEDLYEFWRNFENLPLFMEHLVSVSVTGPTQSHWVAKGPAGKNYEWDAEIYNEIPNELIAWRSLEESEVRHAGSVQFRRIAEGLATEVKVEISYVPTAGLLGSFVAKLFGEEPGQQVDADLQKFKQLAEAGEIPTKVGQLVEK